MVDRHARNGAAPHRSPERAAAPRLVDHHVTAHMDYAHSESDTSTIGEADTFNALTPAIGSFAVHHLPALLHQSHSRHCGKAIVMPNRTVVCGATGAN